MTEQEYPEGTDRRAYELMKGKSRMEKDEILAELERKTENADTIRIKR